MNFAIFGERHFLDTNTFTQQVDVGDWEDLHKNGYT
jgi:hypothetical protein